jgi:hypothetical protein
MSVTDDPRWMKWMAQGLKCSCGETHIGPFALHMLVPAGWTGSKDYEPDSAIRMDGDFLSQNLCVREGKYFAIRTRLPIPVQNHREHAMVFTVWASLNKPDFEAYLEASHANSMKQNAQAQARLVNRIGYYGDTFGLMGLAAMQLDGAPYFLTDQVQGAVPNHQLAQDQRQGATLDKMFEIYAAQDHDMRASL